MSIALNTLAVILSNGVIRMLGIVNLFMTRRLLGPEYTGIWNFIMMVSGYAVTFNSGIELAAEQEIPYWRGKGDTQREIRTRNQMFTAVLLESILMTLIVIAVAMGSRGNHRPELAQALFWGAAYLTMWRLGGCYMISLRTLNKFVLLGRGQIILSILDFLLVIPLVYRWRLQGQCVAFGLSLLARVIYFGLLTRGKHLFEIRWHFDRKLLVSLWSVGFPLTLNGLLFQLFISIDSLIVLKRLGTTALGLYSLGWSASRAVAEIPNAFSTVVFPRLMEDFGTADDPQALGRNLRRNLEASAFGLVPPIVCLVYFLFPFLSRHFLHQFEHAIPTLRILIMSGFVLALTNLPGQVFMARKKLSHLLGIMAGACTLAVAASWFSAPHGIWFVSLSVLVVYGVYFSILLFWAFWRTLKPLQAVRSFALLFGGVVYIILAMTLADQCTRSKATLTLGWDVLQTGAGICLSLILMGPLFWKANKDLHLIKKLNRLWRERY